METFGGREKAKFIIHVYTSRVYTQQGGIKKYKMRVEEVGKTGKMAGENTRGKRDNEISAQSMKPYRDRIVLV